MPLGWVAMAQMTCHSFEMHARERGGRVRSCVFCLVHASGIVRGWV